MSAFKISTSTVLATNDFKGNVKNDSGTILFGGNIASSRFVKEDLALTKTFLGGQVVASGTGVTAALPAAYEATPRRFANEVAGQYVIAGITSTLAGQSKTALATAGADDGLRQTPHKLDKLSNSPLIADALRKGKYNHVTGAFDSGFPVNDSSGIFDIAGATSGSAGTDKTANDGYGDQGSLRFLYGAPTPSGANYRIKTGKF